MLKKLEGLGLNVSERDNKAVVSSRLAELCSCSFSLGGLPLAVGRTVKAPAATLCSPSCSCRYAFTSDTSSQHLSAGLVYSWSFRGSQFCVLPLLKTCTKTKAESRTLFGNFGIFELKLDASHKQLKVTIQIESQLTFYRMIVKNVDPNILNIHTGKRECMSNLYIWGFLNRSVEYRPLGNCSTFTFF